MIIAGAIPSCNGQRRAVPLSGPCPSSRHAKARASLCSCPATETFSWGSCIAHVFPDNVDVRCIHSLHTHHGYRVDMKNFSRHLSPNRRQDKGLFSTSSIVTLRQWEFSSFHFRIYLEITNSWGSERFYRAAVRVTRMLSFPRSWQIHDRGLSAALATPITLYAALPVPHRGRSWSESPPSSWAFALRQTAVTNRLRCPSSSQNYRNSFRYSVHVIRFVWKTDCMDQIYPTALRSDQIKRRSLPLSRHIR